MKKIIALITLTLILSLSLITVFAVPSPSTSADFEDVTVILPDGTEYEVPKEHFDGYLDVIHVHEAEEGSDLDNVGKDLSTDGKIADEIGEEYKDHTLIQLFTFERKGDFKDGKLELGDFISNEDGSYRIEGAQIIDVSDAKFIVRINIPSLREDDEIAIFVKRGEWAQAEHVRVFNGYLTIEISDISDFESIYALLAEKAPVSPPTGDSYTALWFALATVTFVFVAAWSVRKYRFEK